MSFSVHVYILWYFITYLMQRSILRRRKPDIIRHILFCCFENLLGDEVKHLKFNSQISIINNTSFFFFINVSACSFIYNSQMTSQAVTIYYSITPLGTIMECGCFKTWRVPLSSVIFSCFFLAKASTSPTFGEKKVVHWFLFV